MNGAIGRIDPEWEDIIAEFGVYYNMFQGEKLGGDDLMQDIENMKETGINAVRIREFAWSTMESEEDRNLKYPKSRNI